MAVFCPDEAAWGDVATWMTGIATLSAVAVALCIALLDSRRRNAERTNLERVFAQLLWFDAEIVQRLVQDIWDSHLLGQSRADAGADRCGAFSSRLDSASARLTGIMRNLDSGRIALVVELIGFASRARTDFATLADPRARVKSWEHFRMELSYALHQIDQLAQQCWQGDPPRGWHQHRKAIVEAANTIAARDAETRSS